MALPILLLVGGAILGLGGIGGGVYGGTRIAKAKGTMESARCRHNRNLEQLKAANIATTKVMDALGKKEMEVLSSFDEYSKLMEKVQGTPKFNKIDKSGLKIIPYSAQELKNVSIGASILLGGVGSAALGTFGGFAAAGATTAAVAALGTASTGTAIASLSGAAATKATLAAIGGGAIAAGGGGVALGTTILGISAAGVGLLIGGIAFAIAGSKAAEEADKAYDQVLEHEREIDGICEFLDTLRVTAEKYLKRFEAVALRYTEALAFLKETVEIKGKTDWNEFTEEELLNAEEVVTSVSLLYDMCTVKLILIGSNNHQLNTVNHSGIRNVTERSQKFLAVA